MIIASQKTKKCTKYLEKKTYFLIHLHFLDNKHKCMKVVNAKGDLFFYYHVSFVEGFHLEISYFQISNSKLKSSCILIVHMLA